MSKHVAAFVACAAATIISQAVAAQTPSPATAAPATCPAGGVAHPWYGLFGDNDGVMRAYEIASPCIPKAVLDAATAVGMGRNNPLGVKNVTTIRFQAKGAIGNDQGKMQTSQKIDVSMSYVIPAVRVSVAGTGAPVRVFAENVAWDETSPGAGLSPAAAGAGAARMPLIKLTPFGALWSVIEAEGTVKVEKRGDMTIVSGASPYDGIPVRVTINDKNLPVSAEVKSGGNTYTAAFGDYSDSWESPYLVIFPKHIDWTMNGKPLANLEVTAFHSNPYVIFPPPQGAAKKP